MIPITLTEYKEKLLKKLEALNPIIVQAQSDEENPFGKHPVSFQKAVSIARRKNPGNLIWNCCEYKQGYLFLVGTKPFSDPPSWYDKPKGLTFYYHVNYYTGIAHYYGYLELEMNLSVLDAINKKKVWIDVAEEETCLKSPEWYKLRNKLLTVSLLEEEKEKPLC